jgi:hypothetical protein
MILSPFPTRLRCRYGARKDGRGPMGDGKSLILKA